jgi:hypothetical protein
MRSFLILYSLLQLDRKREETVVTIEDCLFPVIKFLHYYPVYGRIQDIEKDLKGSSRDPIGIL